MPSYNPYAAPAREATGPAQPVFAGEPQPWEVGDAVKSAWEVYKGHWAPLTLGYLVVTLISAVPQYAAPVLAQVGILEDQSRTYWAVHGPLMLFGWLISQFFVAGFVRAVLLSVRSDQASFSDFFAAGGRFVPFVATEVLRTLAVGLGFVLFIVPGVILSMGFKNTPYYVVDQGLGPMAALRASWQSSEGQKGNLFLLTLAQLGIVLLGFAACCLGFVVAVPVVMIAEAIVYMKMSGTAPAPPPPPAAGGPYGYGPPGYGPPGYGGWPGGYGGPSGYGGT